MLKAYHGKLKPNKQHAGHIDLNVTFFHMYNIYTYPKIIFPMVAVSNLQQVQASPLQTTLQGLPLTAWMVWSQKQRYRGKKNY